MVLVLKLIIAWFTTVAFFVAVDVFVVVAHDRVLLFVLSHSRIFLLLLFFMPL